MELAEKCNLLLDADDSVLLTSQKNPKVISETLLNNLETYNDWVIDNRLSLHLGKTEAMICGTKCKIMKKKHLKLNIRTQQ